MLRFSNVPVYWFKLDTVKVRLHKLHLIHSVYCDYELFIFRFTLILSSKHAKELTAVQTPVRRSERFGSANNSSNKFLFPPECFICGIYCKQCSKRNEYTCILLTKDGEKTIRLAAKHKLPLFYRKNKAINLISSELRFHESSCKTFTYGYSNSFIEKTLDLPLLNKSRKTNSYC